MKLITDTASVRYSELPDRLPELIDRAKSDWERRLFEFLTAWFDKRDYITVQTSGSTGKPKKITPEKKQMRASARLTESYFGPWNDSPFLLCLDTRYIAGKMMVVRALTYNINLICVAPESNPLKHLDRNIQFCAMVPPQVQASLDDLHKVRTLIIGGAPVSPQLESRLQHLPTRCLATYGMTETLSHIAVKPLNGSDRDTHFQLLPGITATTDKKNCLVLDAPALGVKNLKTNDAVQLRGNRFKWLGRHDFTINSGGLKIHPEELEKQLAPCIEVPFFLWSEPDERLGRRLVMVVESERKREVLSAIRKAVETALSDRKKHPKAIYFTPKFRLTETEKVIRKVTFEEAKGRGEQYTI